jgi:hypothetical protein
MVAKQFLQFSDEEIEDTINVSIIAYYKTILRVEIICSYQ